MELDVVWRTSDLRLCRHFGLTKLHGSILIEDQGIKRPFGDVHANCTAYTVGLIAVDSHRLKEKTCRYRCMPLLISFWDGSDMFGQCTGLVRNMRDNFRIIKMFLNKLYTDVWFLLGNVWKHQMVASSHSYGINIRASCTSRYSI